MTKTNIPLVNTGKASSSSAAPAFVDLVPKMHWQNLSDNQAEFLTDTSQLIGQWQKLATVHSFPSGYFYCQTASNNYFIKILPKCSAKLAIKANVIHLYLTEQHFFTNVLLAKYNQNIDIKGQTFTLLVYPHVKARFSDFSQTDITLIGCQLAKLHTLFFCCPLQKEVQQQAKIKNDKLIALWKKIKQSPISYVAQPKSAQIILLNEPLTLFDVFSLHAQMIHADLNVGNSLFTENNEVMFIDYEHSLENWSTPLQDIACIIERYILVSDEEKQIEQHFNQLLDQYFNTVKNSLLEKELHQNPSLFAQLLKAMSVKCLLILTAQSPRDKSITNTGEWQKFITLYQQANNKQTWLTLLTKNWLKTRHKD